MARSASRSTGLLTAACLFETAEFTNLPQKRIMSARGHTPAHAHSAHSIEWLYWGHVRIPSLKLRSPLIVLVRKVTIPGAVNFAGPERSTRSMAVWFLALS